VRLFCRLRGSILAPDSVAEASLGDGLDSAAIVPPATTGAVLVSAARRGELLLVVAGVVIVALSRLYLGVHWLSDVIGGALLAGVFVILGTLALTAPLSSAPSTPRPPTIRRCSAPSRRKVG
jgi:PAP2 superfamily